VDLKDKARVLGWCQSPAPTRTRWTNREDELLRRGVATFGQGYWAKIRRVYFPSSTDRSNVDLKDRWRVLEEVLPSQPRSLPSLAASSDESNDPYDGEFGPSDAALARAREASRASRQGVPVRPAAVAARQAADENAHKNSAPRPPHPEEFRRLLCGLYHVVVTAAGGSSAHAPLQSGSGPQQRASIDAPPKRRLCGTPRCTLVDFHAGPCTSWSGLQGARKKCKPSRPCEEDVEAAHRKRRASSRAEVGHSAAA
jgi:hypothetical protein